MAKLLTFPFTLLLLLLLLPITLLQFPTCSSTINNYPTTVSVGGDLCTSSCGDILNISYPFRLNTDPISCGDEHFEITCDDNVPMLYNKSERYYVRSINYSSYAFRLFDASLVPLTNSSTFFCNLSDEYFLDDGYFEVGWGVLVMISCPSPLNISRDSYISWISYADGAICSDHESDEYSVGESTTSSSYWYAAFTNGMLRVEEIKDSCSVELTFSTAMPPDGSKGYVSFDDVRESWSYGFEVSWLYWLCDRDLPREDSCGFREKNSNNFLLLYCFPFFFFLYILSIFYHSY